MNKLLVALCASAFALGSVSALAGNTMKPLSKMETQEAKAAKDAAKAKWDADDAGGTGRGQESRGRKEPRKLDGDRPGFERDRLRREEGRRGRGCVEGRAWRQPRAR